jgi:hypothetical protein
MATTDSSQALMDGTMARFTNSVGRTEAEDPKCGAGVYATAYGGGKFVTAGSPLLTFQNAGKEI